MGYSGLKFPIPLGGRGVFTDAPQSRIPVGSLFRAYNASFYNEALETDYGSVAYNTTAYPSGVRAFYDFWVDSVTRRLATVHNDGTVYRLLDPTSQQLVGPDTTVTTVAPTTLSLSPYVSMNTGGREQTSFPRKLFIYTGYSPVQVISGDASVRHNIQSPAADWTGTNQPIGGIIHRGIHMAWGNLNNPHTVYGSKADDHEDFLTTPLLFSCYPGDGELIVDAIDFRGVMYLVKYPTGVYYLIDADSNPANWYFQKLTDEFGGSCPKSMVSITDDVLIANSMGSVTSLKAALIFGDVTTADVLHQVGARNSTVVETNPGANTRRTMVYYPFKKLSITAFQSPSSNNPDRTLYLDYRKLQQPPLPSWNTKDRPNYLGLVKDSTMIKRPAYAADDGYVYMMDSPTRFVGVVPNGSTGGSVVTRDYYLDVTTSYVDMGQMTQQGGPEISCINKQFEQLEIEYVPTGKWDLSIDVMIDGRLRCTRTISVASSKSELDSMQLDTAIVDSECTMSTTVPIGGYGKRIALRFYSGAQQYVKIVGARIYFRLGDEANQNLGA